MNPWTALFGVLDSFGVEQLPTLDEHGTTATWPEAQVMMATPGVRLDAVAGWTSIVLPAGGKWLDHVRPLVKIARHVADVDVDERTAAWTALYRLLADARTPSPPTRLAQPGARLSLAWPDSRVGFAVEGDNVGPWKRDGWRLVQQPGTASWEEHLAAIESVAFAVTAHYSASTASNPSTYEQRMMEALLQRRVPPPARDTVIPDPDTGAALCQPDFAWPDYRLALDLDGLRWHLDLHVDEVIDAAAANSSRAAEVRNATRSRFVRDARKRRRAARCGWTIVTCTDTELDAGKADDIADDIADLIAQRCPT